MKKIIVATIILLVCSSVFAKMEEYSRKSISIFKMDVSIPAKILAKKSDVNYIYNKLYSEFKGMGRFDYNPIPAGVTDPQRLFEIVKEYSAAKIEKRAAKQWEIKNEFYGSNFITGENVDKIIDGAYILFPKLDTFVVTKKKDKKDKKAKTKYTITQSVSVQVYAATNTGTPENPIWEPKKVATISASGSNLLSLGSLFKLPSSKKGDDRKEALKSSTSGMMLFLKKELKKLDMFKIKALVTKANPKKDKVSFNFGKNVGIHLDDAYTVGYFQKNKAGNEKYVETGFVRVRKVKKEESDTQLLIVNNPRNEKEADLFYEGNQMYEYPLVGLNIVLNGGIGMLKGIDGFDDQNKPEDVDMAPMFGLKAEYNIAKEIQISELYFMTSADLSLPTYTFGNDSDDPDLTVLTGEAGLIKKFYNRQFAWYLGAAFGYHMVNVKQDAEYEYEDDIDEDYYALGGNAFVGFNYMINKTAFLDLTVGVKFYGELLNEDGDEVFESTDGFDNPMEGESYLTPNGIYAKLGFGFTL